MLLFSVLAHIPLHCNNTWLYWLEEAFSRARCWHIWPVVSLQVLISRSLVVQSLYQTPWSLILDLESIMSPESYLWCSARFIFFFIVWTHVMGWQICSGVCVCAHVYVCGSWRVNALSFIKRYRPRVRGRLFIIKLFRSSNPISPCRME